MPISINTTTQNQSTKISTLVELSIKNERKLIENLENRKKYINTKINYLNNIKNLISSLKTNINNIISTKLFENKKVSVSDNSILDAQPSIDALIGEFEFEITSTAKNHIISTSDFSSNSRNIINSIGTGEKSFTLKINQNQLNISITINEEDNDYDILNKITNKINKDENISKHITASLINKSNNTYALLIQSKNTGISNSISFEGENNLTTILGLTDDNLNILRTIQNPQNLTIKYGELEITREKNIVDDFIKGITLSIKKTGKVKLTISDDFQPLIEKLKEFTTSYNKLQTTIGKYIYEEKSEDDLKKGVLYSDSTLKTIRNQLREFINKSFYDTFLFELGFKNLDTKNTSKEESFNINFDEAKFKDFIKENYQKLKEIFISENGFFVGLNETLSKFSKNIQDTINFSQENSKNIDRKISNSEKLLNQRISYYQALYSTLSNRASSIQQEGIQLITILSNLQTKLF